MRAWYIFLFGMLVVMSPRPVRAQWMFSGELRTRSEWRDGYGTLQPIGAGSSVFISQRSRLNVDYRWDRVVFHTAVQDVRVWGQDASTISTTDGGRLAVHEAWAEINLMSKVDSTGMVARRLIKSFSVKIGRQELSYDDQRLIGALDWLQQGRRHDAIVFKLLTAGWQVEVGGAFNQNSDAVNYNGTFYTPANTLPYVKDSKGRLTPTPAGFIPLINASGVSSPNGTPAVQAPASTNGQYQNYKALQYLYAAKTINNTRITALVVADCFGRYVNDSAMNIVSGDTAYVYGKQFDRQGVNTRVTGGLYATTRLNRLTGTAGLYYQGGRDRDAKRLDAWTSTLSVSYNVDRVTGTCGWDYLSGNNAFSTSKTNHGFDPLYGTPHKFWGSMDYFYVSTGSPTGGLHDLFLKGKYSSPTKRLTAGLDYHCFLLAEDQRGSDGQPVRKYLGGEVDGVTTYTLNKATTVELGGSWMGATQSMATAKAVAPNSSRLTGWWSYLMITFLFNNRSNKSK